MKRGLFFITLLLTPVLLSAQYVDNSMLGDVLINEVMADARGLKELPETEYVEIYNVSGGDISLNSWAFVYDGKDIKLPNVVLPADSFAVLYRAGKDIIVASGALTLGISNFPASLAIAGKTIGLKNSKDEYIDEMTYPAAKSGFSYERGNDGTWHLSTDAKGGTPGAINSLLSSGDNSNDPVDSNDPADDPTDETNPNPGNIVINEVMADPKGLTALPETEYVEIYNASDDDISLFSWAFVYDGKDTKLPDIILPAGGYAVLYRSPRDIIIAQGAISLGLTNFPSALANAGKTIGIKNPKGELIDELAYPKAKAGKSYERDNNGAWHISTDEKGGTPGAVNSPPSSSGSDKDENHDDGTISTVDNAYPGDVLITEVMANPKGLSLLPETEYVEIFNASESDISLKEWVFVYDSKETKLPDVVLSTGSFAVLYRSPREISVAPSALSLGIATFPSALANAGKTIGLKNPKGDFIDEMTYTNAIAGKSFERADDGSWYLSTDVKGGTPGAANSPPPPTENGNNITPINDNSKPGDVLINEVMANPKGLTLLPETEYVEIYNTSKEDIPIYGWRFIYDGKETDLPNVILPVGAYAVLYRADRPITVAAGALSLGIDKFPSAIANTSKTLGLKNSKGALIDEMTYPNAKAAKSYERADEGTWHESTDTKGGTPGAKNSPPPQSSTDTGNGENENANPNDNSVCGDVLINEVMANPKGLTLLPETEYVEIFNATTTNISLKGWIFIYDGKETALPDVNLPMGRYAVLYRAGREINVASDALSLGIERFPSALANTGKTVGLKNSKGIVIDEMTYPVANAGKSYERANNNTWYESTDIKGGTPGSPNSPPPTSGSGSTTPVLDNSKPGDLIINEVMADPNGLTMLPQTEYVEIYNASGADLSLNGWAFIYDGKDTPLPDIVLLDDEFAVLYRAGREISVAPGALSLGIAKFPSALANSGKTVGLKNANGVLIDELTYPKATAGKSYERADDGIWHLSTDEKGGTPGAINSDVQAEDADPVNDNGENPDDDTSAPDETPSVIDYSLPGDVLINEVMANPNGLTLLPQTEYVEIYNTTDDDIPLKNWVFIYDGKDTNLPDTVLLAGGYAVLFRAGREMVVPKGALLLGIANFPAAIANTSKTIGLKNSKGELIDELTYPNAKTGKSYERANDGSWHVSTNEKGGTPGAENSLPPVSDINPGTNPNVDIDEFEIADPFDLIINEILPEPFANASEYIELYNRSGRTLSLANLVVAVRKTDGTLSTRYPLSSLKEKILPNGYVVLTKDYNGVTDFYSQAVAESVYELHIPVLNNQGASIVLFRAADEVIIEEVTYSTKWHNPSIKNKKGVSLERIDPDKDSQDASNWTSATANTSYGTPGYKNSQHKNADIQENTFINAPEYQPGLDYYILAFQTSKQGFRCRVEVYSTNGRKVAELMNNQLIAQDGELRWDGKGVDNSRLKPGVYVFYAELYHPDGDLKKFKKAFLVR